MKKYVCLMLPAMLATACNSGEEITTTQIIEPAAAIVEYTPAPGQFINDPASGAAQIATAAEACAYAERRLKNRDYVSLGGWGGYLVARFARPVPAESGNELLVAGNPMANSSEPGVVWVMQDRNGNGIPGDDPEEIWYELKGSEYDHPDTRHAYSIVYYRPEGDGQPVRWKDGSGEEGQIDRIDEHRQASYYPAWLADRAELTFEGVRLPDNIQTREVEGQNSHVTLPFAWGYADNYASDLKQGYNQFSIAHAVTASGQPAGLTQIDFVKVQTGVRAKAPLIGEISTEVCAIACIRTVTE